MRRGHDNGWLKDETGKLIGVNLGADFTAEHEWGIKEIQSSFGISTDRTIFGIKRRTITKVPGKTRSFYQGEGEVETLAYREWGLKNRKNPPCAALIFERHGAERYLDLIDGTKKPEGGYFGEIVLPQFNERWANKKEADDPYYTFATAWDSGSFGINVKGLGNVNQLREIYEAIKRLDIAIWTGGGHVFKRAGLVLGIVSRCPAGPLEDMRAADEDRLALEKASEAIGLGEELKAKGKQWFALSPTWSKSIRSVAAGEVKTDFPVMYWLNPYDQQKYDSGWFTVEQLREWADEKGPVIKSKEKVK